MLLIGQYDSPFVRRVAVTLNLYGVPYENVPLSTFGDAEAIATYNPLRRVPVLVMDDGVALTDSMVILEALDRMVSSAASLDRPWPERREMLRLAALTAGVADKGVSLLYERAFRETALDMWVARCRSQVGDTLAVLERERAARTTPWLFGESLSHADVILATVYRFITEALEGAFDMAGHGALTAHADACEAMPAFASVYKPYTLTRPGEG